MKNQKPDFWEAIQTISGELYLYRNGFKEEADVKDVFTFATGDMAGKSVYHFSRFDFNPLIPAPDSTIRMNRANIAFAWYVDPSSDVITELKKAIPKMDIKRAGMIVPSSKVV